MSDDVRPLVLPMLDDLRVREMADQNHQPEEIWMTSGRLASLRCDACAQSWPCETRKALDEQRLRFAKQFGGQNRSSDEPQAGR